MTTEASIEQATIDWLTDLGYTHKLGTGLPQNNVEVVLTEPLLQFIEKQYPNIPKEIQALAVAEFTNNVGADLDHRNRDFHLKLTKGKEYAYEDSRWTGKSSTHLSHRF